MDPVKMRIRSLLDFGLVVHLAGVELSSNRPVAVTVDYRPLPFWETWRATGFAEVSELKVTTELDLTLELEPACAALPNQAELPDD